ncbi:hypothetical protein EGR52_09715 [bacterium]|nr:hypothetical protein [bacterium]
MTSIQILLLNLLYDTLCIVLPWDNVDEEEIYDCINNNITITIFNEQCLDLLLKLNIKDKLKVHVLVNNGSNLLGVNDNLELKNIVDKINTHNYIELEGIYTDITTLGIEDEYFYNQVNAFYQIANNYFDCNLIIHFNESLMYHHKISYVNGIRFDLSILGIEENIEDDFFTNMKIKNIQKKYNDLEFPNIDLELVFNITSEVMDVKKVTKGSIVGRSYVAKDDMYVAIIPIGHKDGITKAIKYVGINNYKRNILADEIDKIIVEVSNDVRIKDKVYILNEERGIYDFLSLLKTNRYYLMSILNRNLKKVYINEEDNNLSLL